MAQNLLTISHITHQALMLLKNKLALASRVTRGYDDQFAQKGAKKGNAINIRKPIRPIGRRGLVAKYDDIDEPYVQLTLQDPVGVDLHYNTYDLTLSMDDFSRRYIEPSVARIANIIDEDGLMLYNQFPWVVGTPGATPNTLLTFTTAAAILTEEGAPRDSNRTMLLNPNTQAVMSDALKTLFNPQATISMQNKEGMMGDLSGWAWLEDANIITHQVGPLGGTPLVNGANQTGTTLLTKGWTAAAAARLKRGDTFTIAGVFAVNPMSRRNTGRLRKFRVVSDFSSDASGNGAVTISPPITPPSAVIDPFTGLPKIVQFQTVTASPADSAAITVDGTANVVSPQNLGFHRSAIILGMADLEIPRGVGTGRADRVSDPDSGVSIRIIEYYNGENDIDAVRMDCIYGYCVAYETLGVRVAA